MQKCERSKSRTFTVVILFCFDINKMIKCICAGNELYKVVIVSGSNNARAAGILGRILRRWGNFIFFLKTAHFKHVLV